LSLPEWLPEPLHEPPPPPSCPPLPYVVFFLVALAELSGSTVSTGTIQPARLSTVRRDTIRSSDMTKLLAQGIVLGSDEPQDDERMGIVDAALQVVTNK
jgi:hypothetical protein